MTTPVNFYADPSGLAALKKGAGDQDPKALREAARQFESLFTQMMLKSMRDASKSFRSQDSLTDSDQTDFYREMFDNQMAMQLSKGRGLGLADMLVRQLAGSAAVETRDAGHETRKEILGTQGARGMPLPESSLGAPGLALPPVSKQSSPVEQGRGRNGLAVVEESRKTIVTVEPTKASVLFRSLDEILASPSSIAPPVDAEPACLAPQVLDDDPLRQVPSSIPVEKNFFIADLSRPVSRVPRLEKAAETSPSLRDVTTATPTATSPRLLANSPADFVAQLWPHAEAVGRELGVDPKTLIAHAALETGWGKNVPANLDGSCSFNLFGMKATGRWRGQAAGVNTLEYEDGVAVQKRASFRAYDSPADSFRDYAALIRNSPRYAAALGSGKDAAAFANALQQGGYATDPNYATKLTAVADRLGAALKTTATRPLAPGRSLSSGGET